MRLGGAVLLALAALAGISATAFAAQPALYLDFGTAAHPGTYLTQSWNDTAAVRVWVELNDYPSKVEGLEFFVAYDCSVTAACAVARSVDVLSFQPDSSLIGSADRRLCDDLCPCMKCEAPSHFRLHFRTDRLSTIPADLKACVGTLHVRTTVPMKSTELHFELASVWVFGQTPLETRTIDATKGDTATFGGITAAGHTSWGVLRRIYR